MSWVTNDLSDIKDGGGLRLTTIIHLCIYAALLYCVVFLAKNYLNEAVLRARAEAKSEAAKDIQEAAKAKEATEKKEITVERQAAHSDAELIALLNRHVFPQTPLAPVPAIEGQLPDAPSATLNRSQLEGLADYQVKCRICESEKTSLATQLRAEQDKAKAWEQAAKGGTKWQRLRKAGKCLGFSALGSGIGALTDRKYPARGAVIGSTVGSAGCQLF